MKFPAAKSSLQKKGSSRANRRGRVPIMKLGMLSSETFAVAAETIPAFSAYADYGDWLDAREGLLMGYAMCGVDAEFTPVSLTALLAWGRLTETQPDEASLDRLATWLHAVRLAPTWRRDPVCDAPDFATLLPPTASGGDLVPASTRVIWAGSWISQ
jgi:hypothetical protein